MKACPSQGRISRSGVAGLPQKMGLWRSWERASMAWKRSTVRTRPGPPKFFTTYTQPQHQKHARGVQLESVWRPKARGHLQEFCPCQRRAVQIQVGRGRRNERAGGGRMSRSGAAERPCAGEERPLGGDYQAATLSPALLTILEALRKLWPLLPARFPRRPALISRLRSSADLMSGCDSCACACSFLFLLCSDSLTRKHSTPRLPGQNETGESVIIRMLTPSSHYAW